MIRKYKHIVAYLLLFSIATVCFPLQEFFHDHHSEKEICESQSHHKCEHTHHFGTEKHNIGCHFCLINKVFTTQDIHFTIFIPEIKHYFNFTSKSYQNTEREYSSRGPPVVCIA